MKREVPTLDAPGVLVAFTLSTLVAWYSTFLAFGPRLAINHDELGFVHGALRLLGEGRLEGYAHGPLLHEVIAIVEAGFYLLNRVPGLVNGPVEFLATLIEDPHPHLVLGRAVSALAAVWLVVEVGRLGHAISGRTVAACSMALCASNLTFIALTSVCKEEGLFWALSISSLRLAWVSGHSKSSHTAVKAGVLLGAASATKLFGILWSVIVLLPVLRRERDPRHARAQAITMTAAAVGSFLLLYPFVLTDTDAVIASQRRMHSYSSSLAPRLAMHSYVTTHLPNLLGWPVFVAAVIEVGWRLLFERRGPVLLLLAPCGIVLFLGLRPGLSVAYYAFPLAMLLCIIVVAGAVRVGRAFPGRWSAIPVVVLMLLALSDSAFLRGSIKHGLILLADDAREIMRARVLQTVPAGACIIISTAISGEDFYGPRLLPATPPEAGGQFRAAERIAWERSAQPRYDVRTAESRKSLEECDWMVKVQFANPSVEFGSVIPAPTDIGWKAVAIVDALPDDRTYFFPFLSTEEYRHLREHSIAEVASRRRLGWTLSLLMRTLPVAVTGPDGGATRPR